VSGLLERFRNGDRQALARLLTHIENQSDLGQEALRHLTPLTGHAHILGLTGPPGAGKSTLAGELIKAIRTEGRTIAVLAIDPSSPLTGGATLGDRIRMLDTQDDEGVYLRSMASRGQLGGLNLAAFGAIIALDSFGFDVVLIETVGAGQDEVDIARVADSVMVVQTPGMGDSIQAVKAGILEIADLLIVNKADQPGADEVIRDLREQVRTSTIEGWRVPVIPVVAADGTGIFDVLNELKKHNEIALDSLQIERKRAARFLQHAKMLALRRLSDFLDSDFNPSSLDDDPTAIADEMLAEFTRSIQETSLPSQD
jgi:LAO/AO transport system kinase